MVEGRDERSLGDLFAELARETSTLVRQELELASTEMSQRASRAGKDAAILVLGGAVAYAGFLALVAAVILVLGELGLPWWLAAFIVGALVIGAGSALVTRARAALQRADLLPRKTIETLKEDREWVNEQTS